MKGTVCKTVATIEDARVNDSVIGRKLLNLTSALLLFLKTLPQKLRELYYSNNVFIYVGLDQGELRRFTVGNEAPSKKDVDFTVRSEHEIAKKNFQSELNLVSTFIKCFIIVSC